MQTHRGETPGAKPTATGGSRSAHIGNLRSTNAGSAGRRGGEETPRGHPGGEAPGRVLPGADQGGPRRVGAGPGRPEPGQRRPAENRGMSGKREGCRVTNRLDLSWATAWVVDSERTGRTLRGRAHGNGHGPTRDRHPLPPPGRGGNGPPWTRRWRRPPAPRGGEALARAVDLARAGTEGTDRSSRRRLAGALMTTAVHMLQEDGAEEWTMTGTPPFPFSMRLKPQ